MKEEALLPDVSECISKFKLTFKNVIDSEIEALFVDTTIKFHKKGDYIYNEGARIKGCYFLFSGIVKIFQTGIAGKDHMVRHLRHGEAALAAHFAHAQEVRQVLHVLLHVRKPDKAVKLLHQLFERRLLLLRARRLCRRAL